MAEFGKALSRGLDILEALLRAGEPLSYGELQGSVDTSPASFTRYLRLLLDRGYVSKDADGAYFLGWRLRQMGRMVSQSPLGVAGAEHVRAVVEETGEAAELVQFQAGSMLFLDRAEGPQPVGVKARPGTVFPLGPNSAIGVLAMATGSNPDHAMPPGRQNAILQDGYVGMLQNDDEVFRGAAAIRDAADAVVGCLTIVAPAFRVGDSEREHYRACLLRHAAEVSRRLGCREPSGWQAHEARLQ